MIGQGAPVELRLGDRTYSLNATPLREGWQAVLEAYVAKYKPNYPEIIAGMPPVAEATDRVVFRLSRS
jgi:hypothetical protein